MLGAERTTTGTRSATIHWAEVPLRDAVARLTKSFDDVIFVDRRIDPNTRVSVDVSTSSAATVLTAIAAKHGWGVNQLGRCLYLGPAAAAQRIDRLAAARTAEVSQLPRALRRAWQRKQVTDWPRLAQPRELVSKLVESYGWKVANAEKIPHDLWLAGKLPAMTLAEQLTILLAGFDLTFSIREANRAIEIVPIDPTADLPAVASTPVHNDLRAPNATSESAKQVYSLRVAEKPVGPVLRELARRLNWQVEFDDAAIQAAGRSLDKRVSFSVEDAERDAVLDALLRPAGLAYELEGDRIKVVPAKAATR